MKSILKVLIAEDNGEFCQQCVPLLEQAGCEVMIVPRDGIQVRDSIIAHEPDLALFDIFMPRLDGLGVLLAIKQRSPKIPTVCVLTTACENDEIAAELMRAGAVYCFVRPLDPVTVSRRLMEIAETHFPPGLSSIFDKRRTPDIELQVTEILHQIGVPAHIKGYHYLRDAILFSVENPDAINAITKVLYPTVAQHFSTTPSRVERAIRHAIEVAWDRGDVDVLNSFFGYTIHNTKGKPTNSEFVAMISDRLRLEQRRVVAS